MFSMVTVRWILL
jgi:hypothetical protein